MKVEDVYVQDRRLWLRLREKRGKRLEMPCHHNLETYLQAYLDCTEIAANDKGPLFRSNGRTIGQLTAHPAPGKCLSDDRPASRATASWPRSATTRSGRSAAFVIVLAREQPSGPVRDHRKLRPLFQAAAV
jgi:hypothetical protein